MVSHKSPTVPALGAGGGHEDEYDVGGLGERHCAGDIAAVVILDADRTIGRAAGRGRGRGWRGRRRALGADARGDARIGLAAAGVRLEVATVLALKPRFGHSKAKRTPISTKHRAARLQTTRHGTVVTALVEASWEKMDPNDVEVIVRPRRRSGRRRRRLSTGQTRRWRQSC